MYDAGVELRWIIVGYVIIAIVCTSFSTFVLLPKSSIAAEEEEPSLEENFAVELGVNNQAVTSGDKQKNIQSVGDVKEFDDISKQPSKQEDEIPVNDKSIKELGISNLAVTSDTEGYQVTDEISSQPAPAG